LAFAFRFQTESVYNCDMSTSGQSVRSLIEGLPSEIAKRVHPDWQKNETEYWAQRDTLLRQYAGQWIGFAEGRVISCGTSPVEVFHAVQASGKHPFVTRVGHENEPNRMRRASFAYDLTYPNEPLPVMRVEFRRQLSTPRLGLREGDSRHWSRYERDTVVGL
jgi:hypothetical protein